MDHAVSAVTHMLLLIMQIGRQAESKFLLCCGQDAAVSSLIGEVAAILIAVYGRCGEELLATIHCTGWPQPILEQLTAALQGGKVSTAGIY